MCGYPERMGTYADAGWGQPWRMLKVRNYCIFRLPFNWFLQVIGHKHSCFSLKNVLIVDYHLDFKLFKLLPLSDSACTVSHSWIYLNSMINIFLFINFLCILHECARYIQTVKSHFYQLDDDAEISLWCWTCVNVRLCPFEWFSLECVSHKNSVIIKFISMFYFVWFLAKNGVRY